MSDGENSCCAQLNHPLRNGFIEDSQQSKRWKELDITAALYEQIIRKKILVTRFSYFLQNANGILFLLKNRKYHRIILPRRFQKAWESPGCAPCGTGSLTALLEGNCLEDDFYCLLGESIAGSYHCFPRGR